MLRWSHGFVATAAVLALAGCSAVRPAPVVQGQTLKVPEGAMKRIAVVPFTHRDTLRTAAAAAVSPEMAAELVTRFMTEAIAKRGVDVIPASDVATAFSSHGLKAYDINPRTAAEVAAREFGATSIMMGQVSRYREREGESFGATSGASVAFSAVIYAAPVAYRFWTKQFDETQRPLSENIVNARRYPGGGTRWLTAVELAQWGAQSMVETIPAAP
jgi:hypothetical protein